MLRLLVGGKSLQALQALSKKLSASVSGARKCKNAPHGSFAVRDKKKDGEIPPSPS